MPSSSMPASMSKTCDSLMLHHVAVTQIAITQRNIRIYSATKTHNASRSDNNTIHTCAFKNKLIFCRLNFCHLILTMSPDCWTSWWQPSQVQSPVCRQSSGPVLDAKIHQKPWYSAFFFVCFDSTNQADTARKCEWPQNRCIYSVSISIAWVALAPSFKKIKHR